MLASVGGLCIFFGSISLPGFLVLLFVTDFTPPPIPVGYIWGWILMIIGTSVMINQLVFGIISRKDNVKSAQKLSSAVIAAGVIAYGVRESFWLHPLELSDCPCAANYYGEDCTFCPNTIDGVCNLNGICDDGKEGSGKCFCDYNWGGESCEVCAPTFQGTTCDTCKRGWTGEKCDSCYPGYSGANCDVCADGWVPETDIFGVLCRRCLPGYFGGFCEKCQNCTLHDPLAVCRDNEWHELNIYDAEACTPVGQTCSDKYDCENFNCKGICVLGDETTGQVCEVDGECFPGTCQFKQCCVEARHGNGHCECGSLGHEGEDCRSCPGFDGVYSETICTGHGTCAAEYANNIYVGLTCKCAPEGTEPYPAWTGETCSCLKNNLGDISCSKCATGSWGPQCNSCPGGSGIGQCNMHGKCDDGISGQGTCECDIDLNYGGIGAFKGDACQSCLSDDFYSEKCQPCPNFQSVTCFPGFTEIPNTGLCTSSCGAKTCNAQGICVV